MSIEEDYGIPTEIIVADDDNTERCITLTEQTRAELLACSVVVHLRAALEASKNALKKPIFAPLSTDLEADRKDYDAMVTKTLSAFEDVEHHARILADHVLRRTIT